MSILSPQRIFLFKKRKSKKKVHVFDSKIQEWNFKNHMVLNFDFDVFNIKLLFKGFLIIQANELAKHATCNLKADPLVSVTFVNLLIGERTKWWFG